MSDSPRFVPALRFRWLTPAYDAIVARTTREAAFKTALIEQAGIRRGHCVLDVGCGTGTLAIQIKRGQPGALVTGIDGDPEVLRRAAAKAEAVGTPIVWKEGLSTALPVAGAPFDRVVSTLFFHHLTWDDKVRTAREVFRVLRPGGEFHLADWGRPSNALMRGLFFAIQMLDGVAVTRDSVRGRLPEAFRAAAFEQVIEGRTFDTMFGTIALYRATKPA